MHIFHDLMQAAPSAGVGGRENTNEYGHQDAEHQQGGGKSNAGVWHYHHRHHHTGRFRHSRGYQNSPQLARLNCRRGGMPTTREGRQRAEATEATIMENTDTDCLFGFVPRSSGCWSGVGGFRIDPRFSPRVSACLGASGIRGVEAGAVTSADGTRLPSSRDGVDVCVEPAAAAAKGECRPVRLYTGESISVYLCK